jgi:predicted RecB family nuclease
MKSTPANTNVDQVYNRYSSDRNSSMSITHQPGPSTDRPNTKNHTYSKKNHNDEDEIFRGVTYKRSVRYYMSGLTDDTTRAGIMAFLNRQGIKVTHIRVFESKYGKSPKSAKIHISPECVETLESDEFFLPDGVRMRRWLSVKQWHQKWADREEQEEEVD